MRLPSTSVNREEETTVLCKNGLAPPLLHHY
jgi:hypothetical protein